MAAMTIQANAKKRKEEEESGLDFTDSPSFKSKWNNVDRDKLRELTTNKDKNRRSSVSAQEERLIREESLQQQRLERFSTAGPVGKAWHRFTMILDSVSVQSILYLSFVIMFQSLSTSVRNPKEFWLTKVARTTSRCASPARICPRTPCPQRTPKRTNPRGGRL